MGSVTILLNPCAADAPIYGPEIAADNPSLFCGGPNTESYIVLISVIILEVNLELYSCLILLIDVCLCTSNSANRTGSVVVAFSVLISAFTASILSFISFIIEIEANAAIFSA